MPWKQLIQIVLAGGQVVGRAFLRAFRQELRASQQAAEQMRKMKQGAPKKSAADMTSGISLQEAKDILNVSDIQDVEELNKNYKHLFEVNDKSKGGSFYLQSKVFRAKERIDSELKESDQGDSTTGPDKKTSSET